MPSITDPWSNVKPGHACQWVAHSYYKLQMSFSTWQWLQHSLLGRKHQHGTHIENPPAQKCTVWFPSGHLAPVSTHLIHRDGCHANTVLASSTTVRQCKVEATHTVGNSLSTCEDMYMHAFFFHVVIHWPFVSHVTMIPVQRGGLW